MNGEQNGGRSHRKDDLMFFYYLFATFTILHILYLNQKTNKINLTI